VHLPESQIAEMAAWVTAQPSILNDEAFAPVLQLLADFGAPQEVVRAIIDAPRPTSVAPLVSGIITRRTGNVSVDAARAASQMGTAATAIDQGNSMPWSVLTGAAFCVQAQNWSAPIEHMYPYVSKCGTVVGFWLGGLGYLGGTAGHPTWVPLPQPTGFNPTRLFVTLAHLTSDPGRRGRLCTAMAGKLRNTTELLHSPFLPFRIQLTYATANPSDDQAVWKIDPACVAGRVFGSVQRIIAQEVLAHATVFEVGMANTVFPVLSIVTA
jgi:hypothetical protein